MEKERKLLIICKYSSIILIVILIIFYAGYLQPLTSIKMLFRSSWLLMLICGGLLFFVFTLVEYYYKKIIDYNLYLKTFHQFQMDAVPTMPVENLSVKTLEVLKKIFGASVAVFVINDSELKQFAKNTEFVINEGVSYAIRRRHMGSHYIRTFYPGILEGEIMSKVEEIIKKYSLSSFPAVAIVPFANENHVIATAIVSFDRREKDFFDYIKEPVEIFSKQVSSIFESAALHQKIVLASITDPLTGLYNKRYFQQRIKEEISKAKRNYFPVSVIISDLDNFKYYVDKYGHPLTDVLLSQFASFVKKLLRESDIICRFGGDEFIYLLPFSGSLEAYRVAERIKSEVVSHEFQLDNRNSVYITISFGIASYPEHGDTWEEIVKKADRALFISKEKGKNMVSIYRAE
ncbi:MAG: GGDEF domain-containing protein [Candidatus Omnitrophica bacterium]|nr:GGDEF domain-containing protein [Candidatus Omnitrophota bacterium]